VNTGGGRVCLSGVVRHPGFFTVLLDAAAPYGLPACNVLQKSREFPRLLAVDLTAQLNPDITGLWFRRKGDNLPKVFHSEQ
jgi:hypothetical protein